MGKRRRTSGALLFSIILTLCGAGGAVAQDGDLSGGLGVFVEPPRPKATRARERERTTAPRKFVARGKNSKAVNEGAANRSAGRARPDNRRAPAVTAESLNEQAEALLSAGRFAEAVEPARQAARLKPDYADAAYNLGFALHSIGDHAGAVEPLTRAAKLNAQDAEAVRYLGVSLARLGRHAEAARSLEQAARLAPRDAELQAALGDALVAAGEPDRAVEAYRRAVGLSPEDAEVRLDLADLLFERQKFAEAVENYKQVTFLTPQNLEAQEKLGDAYSGLSKFAEAAAAYGDAARLASGDAAELRLKQGYALGRARRWPEAAEALRQALRLRPNYTEAAVNLAWVYNNSGRFRESVDLLRTTALPDGGTPAAHFNLGMAYSRLAQSGSKKEQERKELFTGAVESFRAAIRLKPDWAEAHNNLGVALGSTGRYQEAILAHSEAVRLKPAYPGALFNLAYAYRKSGDKKKARETYEQLRAMNPDLAEKLYPLIK